MKVKGIIAVALALAAAAVMTVGFAACGENDEWSVMRRGYYKFMAYRGQAERPDCLC